MGNNCFLKEGHRTARRRKGAPMNCVLFCKRKGIIFPWNSGQGNHYVMDWASFLQRMQRIRRWALGKDPNWQIFGKELLILIQGILFMRRKGLLFQADGLCLFASFIIPWI